MKIQLLDKAKKKKILTEIEEIGIKKIPEMLVKTGIERIKAFSGHLDKEEIYRIWRMLPIEGIGLYVAKEIIDKKTGKREIRLSIDSLHLWQKQITKNIIILTKEQEEEWFKGKNIELTQSQKNKYPFNKCFVAVKSYDGKDFIGTGKTGDNIEILYNYLPKERRRKN